jgi:2-polyprenyl-3-methyl-5-hydroxy-6-metoxy-1,4-benzoquinol methylase
VSDIDPDRLKAFQLLLFSKLEGAVTAGMVHLGDKLGLYRTLAVEGPMTTAELAAANGLDERWVREWAYNQAAAHLVEADLDGDAERFTLTPESTAVLADGDHEAFGMGMFHQLPQTMDALHVLPDAFRSGIGQDYDAHGPEAAAGGERSFGPWNAVHLVPDVLPALAGVVDKLTAGGSAADVGCGAGVAVLLLAAAFPASQFAGYDISEFALARANARLAESGLANASFHDPRVDPLPADGSLDLVTTFDCIHDMTDPLGMMQAIRSALADDGTWLLVEIKALDSLAENVAKNPMASMM